MQKTLIAIDPGTKTGVAIKDLYTGKYLEILTLKIHEAMDMVAEYRARVPNGNLFVIFEDARQRKWFGKAGREKLQGAGSIKRDCVIWQDYLDSLELPYHMQAPKKGVTKVQPDYFRRLTKWTKRTSEHARDAAMLAHGINARNLKLFFQF